jgi:hypothetical protein
VRPPNWDTKLFGAGVIDAVKVLSAPLPAATAMAVKAVRRQARFDQFASLFDDVPRPALRRGLAAFLGTSEESLPARLEEVGDELLYHFISDGQLRSEFRAQIAVEPPGALIKRKPAGKAKSKSKVKTKAKPAADPADILARIASPYLAAHIEPQP